jgi:hypothetical protein
MNEEPTQYLQELSKANGVDCLVMWHLRQLPLPERIREAARLAQLLLNYGCIKAKAPANDDH